MEHWCFCSSLKSTFGCYNGKESEIANEIYNILIKEIQTAQI